MDEKIKSPAPSSGGTVYVSNSVRLSILELLKKIKEEGFPEYHKVPMEVDFIPPDWVFVDLRIVPDGKYCKYSPPYPPITRGGDFVISNETEIDPVRVYFPVGVFLGADGQVDGMDYVDVPAGETRTLVAIQVQTNEFIEFLVSCADGGTGGGPTGQVKPPP